jgi:hypothetical protein
MQSAYQSWAQWEAINNRFSGKDGQERGHILEKEGLDGPIGATRIGLARDAILRTYRLIEPVFANSAERRVSLCQVASDLRQPGLLARLTSIAWAEEHAFAPDEAPAAAIKNCHSLKLFQQDFVPEWGTEKPVNGELATLVAAVRTSRNEIVHGIKADPGALPALNQIRKLIDLALYHSAQLATVSKGRLIDSQTGRETTIEEFTETTKSRAALFWKNVL